MTEEPDVKLASRPPEQPQGRPKCNGIHVTRAGMLMVATSDGARLINPEHVSYVSEFQQGPKSMGPQVSMSVGVNTFTVSGLSLAEVDAAIHGAMEVRCGAADSSDGIDA